MIKFHTWTMEDTKRFERESKKLDGRLFGRKRNEHCDERQKIKLEERLVECLRVQGWHCLCLYIIYINLARRSELLHEPVGR